MRLAALLVLLAACGNSGHSDDMAVGDLALADLAGSDGSPADFAGVRERREGPCPSPLNNQNALCFLEPGVDPGFF